MAHFFDAVSSAPLLTCPIQVGQKKTVGLYGGDFSGNDLGVVIDQDLIRMQEKQRKNNFRYFDLTGLKAGQTSLRAFAGLYDFAFPIEVNITKRMATPQGKLIQRQSIVNEARSHVGIAHYLWGAAGNTPGLSDGAKYRPAIVKMQADSFNLSDPSVLTAFTTVGGLNTCAGSSNNFPQQSIQQTSDYLKTGAALIQNNLTPRTYKFNGQPTTIGLAHNGIVWGEACTSKKHFDCIGFINYCISKFWAAQSIFGTDIKSLMTNPNLLGFVEVSDPTDILNADVIGQFDSRLGWHHIGMVYMSGKTAKVVQAVDSPVGVSDSDTYNTTSWTKRVRLMDTLL